MDQAVDMIRDRSGIRCEDRPAGGMIDRVGYLEAKSPDRQAREFSVHLPTARKCDRAA